MGKHKKGTAGKAEDKGENLREHCKGFTVDLSLQRREKVRLEGGVNW
mgnify:CR=1 FL=1